MKGEMKNMGENVNGKNKSVESLIYRVTEEEGGCWWPDWSIQVVFLMNSPSNALGASQDPLGSRNETVQEPQSSAQVLSSGQL
jgi:hypothetical protein